jgi:hypothetical protein
MIIDPPVSPNLSLLGAGGDAAISGMGDGFETVSQPSFNPLAAIPPEADLRSWGEIRELEDTPHPEASLRPNPRQEVSSCTLLAERDDVCTLHQIPGHTYS